MRVSLEIYANLITIRRQNFLLLLIFFCWCQFLSRWALKFSSLRLKSSVNFHRNFSSLFFIFHSMNNNFCDFFLFHFFVSHHTRSSLFDFEKFIFPTKNENFFHELSHTFFLLDFWIKISLQCEWIYKEKWNLIIKIRLLN